MVANNYLRMRTRPSRDSEVLAGLTKGTILKILSSTDKEETIDTETAYWFRIDMEGLRGWVFGAYIDIVDSKAKADELAREIK